jgi:hypothetical protein
MGKMGACTCIVVHPWPTTGISAMCVVSVGGCVLVGVAGIMVPVVGLWPLLWLTVPSGSLALLVRCGERSWSLAFSSGCWLSGVDVWVGEAHFIGFGEFSTIGGGRGDGALMGGPAWAIAILGLGVLVVGVGLVVLLKKHPAVAQLLLHSW